MPVLNVQTNLPLDGVVTSDILKDASKAVSRILGKPESYVMIVIKGGVPMSFGGTEEPAAFAEVVSIGGLTPENNSKLSAAISEIFERKANVDPGRFYIKFSDMKVPDRTFLEHAQSVILPNEPNDSIKWIAERTDMGWNGSTF